MFTYWALHETPGIVEFSLGSDMGLSEFLLVLEAQNLERKSINGDKIGILRGDEIPQARHMKERLANLLRRAIRWALVLVSC